MRIIVYKKAKILAPDNPNIQFSINEPDEPTIEEATDENIEKYNLKKPEDIVV